MNTLVYHGLPKSKVNLKKTFEGGQLLFFNHLGYQARLKNMLVCRHSGLFF